MNWYPVIKQTLASWADPGVCETYLGYIENWETGERQYIEDETEAVAMCEELNKDDKV